MQTRHKDHKQYFDELAVTSQKYFLPYIERFFKIDSQLRIIEIGCGEGGNLLPFARMGCDVTGVDIAEGKIKSAITYFEQEGSQARFIASDVFKLKELEHQFDLIICHDVIEHITDKKGFISKCQMLLKPQGLMFMSFPAWQMPFGGHQQICQSKLLSHLPWFHLLPRFMYKGLLKLFHERESAINELLDIKQCKCPIERFERVIKDSPFRKLDRMFWFINPHYETKFHLKPRKLWRWVGVIPWIRNFFTTSSFYMLKLK
jgi:SAM-dependent methyltransferase